MKQKMSSPLDQRLLETKKQRAPISPELKIVADICKLDGSLILIPKIKSLLGEPLSISTRFSEGHEGRSYLSIDIVAQRGDKFVPVGIKDYEIQDGIACGNKQRHDKHSAESEVAEIVDGHWATGEGFQIKDTNLLKYAEELTPGTFDGMGIVRKSGLIQEYNDWRKKVYQGRKLGVLMTAVSIIALRYKEISSIKTVTLSPRARHIWEKFGVSEGKTVSLNEIVRSEEIMNIVGDSLI